jgi:hypothetical protein
MVISAARPWSWTPEIASIEKGRNARELASCIASCAETGAASEIRAYGASEDDT